jgi:hypothetical protein
LLNTVNVRPSRCRFYFELWVFYRSLGRQAHRQVDAMTDTDVAATTAVTRDCHGPDPIDLDRLAASLDYLYLGLCWTEPDTVGDSLGRQLIFGPNNAGPFFRPAAAHALALLAP